MSPSVFILPRPSATRGMRYQVRYRVPGDPRTHSGGTFGLRKEAEARARWISGEIAAMRVPDLTLIKAAGMTVADALTEYREARRDVGKSAQKMYRQTEARLGRLGRLEVAKLRWQDVDSWVAALSAASATTSALAPKSIVAYLSVVRQAIDRTDLVPNPARDRRIRLPKSGEVELVPPSWADFQALRETIEPRHRLALDLLEGLGLRIAELSSATWGDLDLTRGALRIARGRTKGGTAGRRFVPFVRPGLLDALLDTCPLEDRQVDGPILPNLREQTIRGALGRASVRAGIPHVHPHALRHRFISLMVLAGLPITVVRQVAGHGRASVTLDTYAHVLLDEPAWRLDGLREGILAFLGHKGGTTLLPHESEGMVGVHEIPAHDDEVEPMEDSGLLSA